MTRKHGKSCACLASHNHMWLKRTVFTPTKKKRNSKAAVLIQRGSRWLITRKQVLQCSPTLEVAIASTSIPISNTRWSF